MTSRDESLERLSERLTEQQLRRVMTQGYTDVALSVMAEYNTKYARMLADSRYSPQSFNKLAQAVQDGSFRPDPSLTGPDGSVTPATLGHTHIGSVGNLCNDRVAGRMDAILSRFPFDRVHAALDALLG